MAGPAAAHPALVRAELFRPLPRRTAPSGGHWPDSHATSQTPSPGGLRLGRGAVWRPPAPGHLPSQDREASFFRNIYL